MQGCPLRCLYCHNPDTWNMNDKKYELAPEEAFEEGMEKVFEANKKLILVQLLATRVNEQAQKMSSLKSGSSAR